ncbi:MAG: protein kinase [Acidobacteria bacterium]|jgi:serine/threonine-protein kinase|nr:protein kinase [Acidobacteriota bacterium]
MANENWQKVREIFDVALQKEPQARQSYVLEACGEDKILLAEVESLFSTFDKLDGFMDKPAVEVFADVVEAETKTLEKGKRFGHYEIIEQIGRGGMGEVYLAQDKKLARKVALKILHEKFAQHESNLQRFISEAIAASGLNHPNILTIYEFGETEDAHYIVSEFIEGKTLREIIRESRLGLPEILDISIQIAGALSAAHKAHLIHRDIKPENIMIRPDGYVKILDFGLAKLIQPKQAFAGLETAKLNETAKGMIMGTVNYMSPEQAKGEQVDERTDIFSFSAVIYEMLAGRTPFQGDSISETFANLINAKPQPLVRFVSSVPDKLQRIVSKMLRKNKDERYQTMKDVLTALRGLQRENLTLHEKLEKSHSPENGNATAVLRAATGDVNKQTAETQNSFSQQISKNKPLAAFALIALLGGAIGFSYYFFYAGKTTSGADGKKSIAVLPLKPISTANRDELFEVGIADSLIHRLNSMKGFVVRPLSATRQYTDISQDPLAAGKEQKVDYVLASNYQLADGKIKITAQLFNVASGQIEETYKSEKDAGDVFAMQDAIAGEMGNKLSARFAITSSSPAARRGTTNEEAYRLYLQGRNLTARKSPANLRKAVEYFEQAVKLDPNYALAYSGMAHAYILSGFGGGDLPRVENEKAKDAVTKALKLDSNLAEGYAVRGQSKLVYEWDFAGAEKDLLRAIELEPNNDLAHWVYALLLNYRGRFDEAMAEIETTLAIDPNSPFYQRQRGRFLYYARRYDEAIVQFKRVIELDENSGAASAQLWGAYEMKGDDAGAYETFIKYQKQTNPEHIEVYQKAYETAGWQGVRQKLLEFDKLDEHKPGSNLFAIARQYALSGDKEQAFEYLNKAFEKHQSQMIGLNVEPALDSLRGDPRFDELVRRVGLK